MWTNSATYHRSFVVARLLVLLPCILAAEPGVPTLSTIGDNHSLWNSANGFAGGHVYSITQTNDGYLWIGTTRGLVRFDGANFLPTRVEASEFPANPSMVGVATEASGQLWTSNGLQLFHLVEGRLRAGLPGKGPQQPQDIMVAKAQDGVLLFAAGFEGIFSCDQGRTNMLVGPGEVPSVPISLARSDNGTLWVGTHTGLFHVDPGTGTRSVHRVEGLPDTTVNALLPMTGGNLLIGTNKGLWSWDGSSAAPSLVADEIKERQILALAKDRDGNVWAGTDSGLFKADANNINSPPNFKLLERLTATPVATALFEDREGNMWVGGLEGIERYRANAFTTYSFSGSLPSENGGPIYVDQESRTWFAPSGGGLFWFRRNHLEAIHAAGLRTDGVYSIAGADGEVWVGRKHGGLTQLRVRGTSSDTVTYTQRNGLAQDAVYSVHRSRDGTVWAGTLSHGLSRVRRGKVTTFTTVDGLPSNTISAIAESASGAVFVGTPNGLGELRDDRWISYTTRDGLPPGAVDCLLSDSTGTLWIGTTKGIAFLRSTAIQVPAGIPGPLSEDILGIAEGGDWLWMSTPNHVLRVQRDALRRGMLKEGDYREYREADGLASVEGVKRNRSVVEDERGQVWFSLNRGISAVQPSVLARQSAAPLIHLDGMLVDEKAMALGGNIRLAPGRHRITISFASVSLTNPSQTRYRYRLDDYDPAWSAPQLNGEASYSNLPPGKFRFRAIARNVDGIWSTGEASVNFEVEPTYWQRPIFQVASFAAFCVMAAGLYRLRLLQLTRRLNLRFEERLAERTRIGRELHDTLLQNLTGLALQIGGLAKVVKEPQAAAEGLQQLKRQAEDCVRETRQSVWDIRTADAGIQDLPGALKHSGEQLTAGKSMRFCFVCEGEPRELPSEVRQHLLRIAREAIGNAVQHAAPAEIRLTLSFTSQEVQLTVSDNGTGFEITKTEVPGHFGLATMTERAHQMRGSIRITSELQKGTTITVRVPRKAR